MKKIVVLFAFLYFSLPQISSAAETGLPSLVKIDGMSPSLRFILSQHLAPTRYVVNKELTFEINEHELSAFIPKEFLTTTTYSWNFGDGTIGEGKKQVHAYEKKGAYIAVLTTTVSIEGFATPTQYRESFLITVVAPDNNDQISKTSLWIVQNSLLNN